VVYLGAFLSLRGQVRGLVGERGLLPACEYLGWVRQAEGGRGLLRTPTIFWWSASDRALVAACTAGALLSGGLIAGLAPIPVLAALWVLYLSLSVAGQVFLQFQWDALLLEAGLLATLYAPPGLRPRIDSERPPSRALTWLLRWLLVRVMLSSGVAKLESGDASWRRATALQHHYETQPLPAPTSWRMHHLPKGFHRLCVWFVWLTEVALPPLGLGTPRLRAVAFVSTATLQALIALTGNYGFFNLLTAALAVPLLDDRFLARPLRREPEAPRGRPWPPEALALPASLLLLTLGAIPFARTLGSACPGPRGWCGCTRCWRRCSSPTPTACSR
jgi:hypothetical protein